MVASCRANIASQRPQHGRALIIDAILESPESFNILREEGTERPFSSPLNNEKRKGTFYCAGCSLALFSSDTKFDSGTGWPSFWDALEDAIETKIDFKLIVMHL